MKKIITTSLVIVSLIAVISFATSVNKEAAADPGGGTIGGNSIGVSSYGDPGGGTIGGN